MTLAWKWQGVIIDGLLKSVSLLLVSCTYPPVSTFDSHSKSNGVIAVQKQYSAVEVNDFITLDVWIDKCQIYPSIFGYTWNKIVLANVTVFQR